MDYLVEKVAYYVLVGLVTTALLGFFFNYSNHILNAIVGISLLTYLECLFITLAILKVADLKDAWGTGDITAFLPLRGTDMGYLIFYLLMMVCSPLLLIKINEF